MATDLTYWLSMMAYLIQAYSIPLLVGLGATIVGISFAFRAISLGKRTVGKV